MSVKTLRFYHERGILEPARVDPANGYRFYNHASIERARAVALLRNFEFSIDEIAEILAECEEDGDVAAYLRRKAGEIEQRLARYRTIQRDLRSTISVIEAHLEEPPMNANVEEKTLPAMEIASTRYRGRYDEFGKHIGPLFRLFGRFSGGSVFSLYWDAEYQEEGADIEACLSLKPGTMNKAIAVLKKRADGGEVSQIDGGVAWVQGSGDRFAVRSLSGGRALSVLHAGGYDSIGDSYRVVMDEIGSRGIRPTPPSREIYLKGPGMIFRGNPARYRTEIQYIIG